MTVYSNSPVCFEGVSQVTSTNSVDVGTRRIVDDEHYIYCYNAGNSVIAPHLGVTLSAVTGYSVTVSSLTSLDLMIGINKHTTIATGQYGWIMTQGFSLFGAHANNSFAAGAIIAGAVDGAFIDKSASTTVTGPIYGKAMEAVASGGSGTGFFTFL